MKITKELLKRHSMGLCSEEEQKAVEEWFKVQDDSMIGLKILDDSKFEPEGKVIWSQLSQAVPELAGESDTKVMPFYKKLSTYAAAILILCTVSLVTYYRLNSAKSNTAQIVDTYQIIQTPGQSHLNNSQIPV